MLWPPRILLSHFQELNQLKDKNLLTTLDAKWSYWQIRVQKESQVNTGIVTFDGLYKYPSVSSMQATTFQGLMQRALIGMRKFCSVYADDI